VLGGGQRVELPTYAFRHQRFWPEPPAARVAGGGSGPGSAAEAGFWAAVDSGDVRGLAAALAIDEGARLAEVLPALAVRRRRERAESVTGNWRYRISWVPVADPGAVVMSGRWLVVVPAGLPGGEPADSCVRAMAARGAEVVVIEAGPGEADRAVLADRIGQAVAGGPGVSGVVSLLGLMENPVAGYPLVARGLAETVSLVQGLGDAGVASRLWVLTGGSGGGG
jgi:hypothetical protein